MVNYKDPEVEEVLNPEALDLAIKAVQTALTAVPWLQKVFGRCHPQITPAAPQKGQKTAREALVPEVYNARSPYDARPNDNLRAYCFFHARDPIRFPGYDALDFSEVPAVAPISIIFWANLKKLDAAKDYDFTDTLMREVLVALRGARKFTLVEAYRQPDRVFAPFTITDTFKQYMRPPYTAFRFDGTLTFDYIKC
jgi:hypothetical protein